MTARPTSVLSVTAFPRDGSEVLRSDAECQHGRVALTTDEELVCRDCGETFVFTAGEQEFFASRGLLNKPSRCPSCRAARRANGGSAARGDRGPRQYHVATCSNCGQEARVPFVPRGDKPVYCSACYQQMSGGGDSSSRW